MDNHELVASCEMLFLTVPFVHAEKVIGEYQQDFSEVQILVDVTVPVVFDKGPRMLELGGENQEPSICKVFCLRDPRWWGPLRPCLRIHCVKWIRL